MVKEKREKDLLGIYNHTNYAYFLENITLPGIIKLYKKAKDIDFCMVFMSNTAYNGLNRREFFNFKKNMSLQDYLNEICDMKFRLNNFKFNDGDICDSNYKGYKCHIVGRKIINGSKLYKMQDLKEYPEDSLILSNKGSVIVSDFKFVLDALLNDYSVESSQKNKIVLHKGDFRAYYNDWCLSKKPIYFNTGLLANEIYGYWNISPSYCNQYG